MNKQLVQDIINAGNKAMNSVPVKYVVKTKDDKYYCYDGLYYDDALKDSVDKCFDCI